jgi:hypothetical protein
MLETNPARLVMATCAITENIQAQLAEHSQEEAVSELPRIVEEAIQGWEKAGHAEAQEGMAASKTITLKTRRLATHLARVPPDETIGSAKSIEYSLKVMKGKRIYYLDTDLSEETAIKGSVKGQGDQRELPIKIKLPRKKERRRLRKAIKKGFQSSDTKSEGARGESTWKRGRVRGHYTCSR